jgi:L-seryl-tRNA(Ser) seleniumtransferase
VEYDILEGKRGRRGSRTERLLAELTGAEDALVVNNCAAAAFFVLSAFAAGGEVVISRGELVEIGGDFRVPDVLTASGATLREVGTTNRTKLSDYELAISSETKLLLRVHPSNYRIVGFTAAPSRREIAALADAKGLLFFEDIGSGALVDLAEYGLADEPKVGDAIANGAHIVSFSGDKLLGGPQCGIIAGRKELIERLRKHPLQRALRADKKTYAALEATLDIYRRGTHFNDVPVLRYLSRSYDEIRTRANSIKEKLSDDLNAEVIDGESVIGGGAAPDIHPRTALLALSHESRSAEQIERKLRMNDPPIIARLSEDRVVIDLRTVETEEDAVLLATLSSL